MTAEEQSEANLHWHKTMLTTTCTRHTTATISSFCLRRATVECCHVAPACQLVDAFLLVLDTLYTSIEVYFVYKYTNAAL